jgi:hypothetical protein
LLEGYAKYDFGNGLKPLYNCLLWFAKVFFIGEELKHFQYLLHQIRGLIFVRYLVNSSPPGFSVGCFGVLGPDHAAYLGHEFKNINRA